MSMDDLSHRDIDLDSSIFMRKLLRELTGRLQDIVGLDEAEGYINSVGAAVGEWIEEKYRDEVGDAPASPEQVAEIFVDLKRRIGGDFHVISVSDDEIVVGNRKCPFGEMAKGRDSLCMMTANVFGRIAADHLGYARLGLHETIARGDGGCRIVVALKPDGRLPSDAKEYYGSSRGAAAPANE